MLTIADKRRTPRHRVLKDGKIVLANNQSVVDCSVRDISETGARLRCADQAAVPSAFRLMIVAENSIRDCQVVWRRGSDIGVEFTSAARRAPPRKW